MREAGEIDELRHAQIPRLLASMDDVAGKLATQGKRSKRSHA